MLLALYTQTTLTASLNCPSHGQLQLHATVGTQSPTTSDGSASMPVRSAPCFGRKGMLKQPMLPVANRSRP